MKKIEKILLVGLLSLIFTYSLPALVFAANEPELPRVYIDTSFISPTGKTIEVKAGGDLQAAIDQAVYGDEIVLQSGSEFTGAFVLKKKSGSGWITIRSSAMGSLPSAGQRVSPFYASSMAKIKSSGKNAPALTTEAGATGYRIVGIEFSKTSPDAFVTNLIQLGLGDESSVGSLPKNIILDRIYAHGDPTSDLKRCVTLNGISMAVIDSYLSDCHDVGADAQAIVGWNGPGPFKIVNNYLEGSGENVLFGGGDPKISGLVPSDIEIRGNHFFKPLSWKIGHPSYAGKPWLVKNLFETKNARRVLLDGNIFENSWTHGQTGTAILIKSTNQGGGCAWCISSDITIRNSIVKNATEGLRISIEGSPAPQKVARVKFENVLFENISGKLFQIFGGTSDVIFENVTAYSPESLLFSDGGVESANPRLVIRNSLLQRGTYGVGAGSEEGKIYLTKYFPGFVFENNTLFNTSTEFTNEKLISIYPEGTTIVTNVGQASSEVGANMSSINSAINSGSGYSMPSIAPVVSSPTVASGNNAGEGTISGPSIPTTTVAPAPVSYPQTSPASTPTTPRGIYIGARFVSTANINVRNTPTITGIVLSKQASGKTGIVVGGPVVASGYTWYQVRYDDGTTGWNAQNFITPEGLAPAASPTVSTVSSPTAFTINLKVGSTGSQVVALQQMLVTKGFLSMPPGIAYGYFGEMTRIALARWQSSNGITPSVGFFGPVSRDKANGL